MGNIESTIEATWNRTVNGCQFYGMSPTVTIQTWIERRSTIHNKWSWSVFGFEKVTTANYYIHQNDVRMVKPYYDVELSTNEILGIYMGEEWEKAERYCIEKFKTLPKNAKNL